MKFIKSLLASSTVLLVVCSTVQPAFADTTRVVELVSEITDRVMHVTNEAYGESIGTANELELVLHFNGKPITTNDGFCFLTKVGGKFLGTNELIFLEPNAKKEWTLKIRGPETLAAARCSIFQ